MLVAKQSSFCTHALGVLSQVGASNDIIMLSTSRSRLQAASLDTPPSIACCVSIHIEKTKLGFPTHISQSQLNSARFFGIERSQRSH